MNAAGTSFLPDLITNSNKQRHTRHSRMKQQIKSLRTESLSDKSPLLSRNEIALFRNSPKQNVCVQLLQEGHHRSFSELFQLLGSDQGRREADPAVGLQTPPLEEQPEKLETMKLHLSQAEHAERTGLRSVVCEQRLLLGRYFSAPADVWLSLYFHHSCADGGGCSRPAVEARVCLAELYLQEDDVDQAMQQAKLSVQQVEDDWLDSDGQSLKLRARRVLWRIYSRLADAPLAAADYSKALKLLREGYSFITQSEDEQTEGEAAYKLGLTYQSAGDHDTAKQLFNSCMQIYGSLQDSDGLMKVYKATAKSFQSEGNIDETVRCLEKVVDISRSDGMQHKLADSFLCLGNIYYSTHQHQRAAENFLQGYEVFCNTGDKAQQQKAQVMVATARTHCFVQKHIDHLRSTAHQNAPTPEPERRLCRLY